jgi:hypothetical protein
MRLKAMSSDLGQTDMNIFPTQLINLCEVNNLNISGRGGKEKLFSLLLPKWTRSRSPLYDYEIEYEDRLLRLEIKKQANEQWFDSGKYYRLSEINQDIIMLFVNHCDGRIDLIAAIKLGAFIALLLSTPEYDAHGWNEEVIGIAADLKKRYPSLQFKAKVRIGKIIKDHRKHFHILYER